MEAKFSTLVKTMISYSREEALRLGNDCISPDHLVLGIIVDYKHRSNLQPSSAISVLMQMNVDIMKLKKKLEESILATLPRAKKVPIGNIPLTKTAEKVLKITYLEAKIRKSNFIESIDLLSSYIRDIEDKESIFTKEELLQFEKTKQIKYSDPDIEKITLTAAAFSENNTESKIEETLQTSPLSLIFNREEYSDNEIKDMIAMLSDLYNRIGGDYLKISGMNEFEVISQLDCV